MKTPRKMSYQDFGSARMKWIAAHCVTEGNSQLCKACGGRIRLAPTTVSIHDARFEACAGSGSVARIVVPYCPQCEPTPEGSGCFHEMPFPIVGRG